MLLTTFIQSGSAKLDGLLINFGVSVKNYIKNTLSILLAVCSFNILANEVTQPIDNLFDAMREHDGAKLLAQFTDNALLQRAMPDGSTKENDVAKFAEGISKTTKYLDEHLISVSVKQSGNLASVWTPYAFYLDKKLSHCGVNSFQLINTEAGWKIQYLIDNTYKGDCQEFINQHKL